MIKLVELLKENGEYPPYMYSPIGFGCHVCKYYYVENDKKIFVPPANVEEAKNNPELIYNSDYIIVTGKQIGRAHV